ncbi:hypothetical protein M404DRAFT_36321 [Pisolithus tinctorius Marx 270]|uniref:Uncharacterized protein n=1 Tax=Pisolithus tinctorius Marx 270 TaxID=870435 RepID=A0A0C3NC83_PISTI|nr:hypothetical protein M404DRAFT_36321 [Pisolithus tinctorius Marx 270]
MGCLVHRSNQIQPGLITAETTDASTSGGAQEPGERSKVVMMLDTQKETNKPVSEPVLTVVGKEVVGGSDDIVDSSMLMLASKQGDATQQAPDCTNIFTWLGQLADNVLGWVQQVPDCNNPFTQLGQLAGDAPGWVQHVATNFERIDDSKLRILKAFIIFVVLIINLVHPEVQIALRVLAATSQLLINQENIGSELSGLFNIIINMYKCLMIQDTFKGINNVKETLGKIALVTYDAVQFIKTNDWNKIGKDLYPKTGAIANMHHVSEDPNFEGTASMGLTTTKKYL